MENPYLTKKDVARILKINNRAVHKLVQTGQLACFRPSERKFYFTEEMVRNYVEKSTNI